MTDEHAAAEKRGESLYDRAISRRSLIAGAAVFGVVLAVPALACGGKSDKDAFDGATQTSTTSGVGASSTTANASTGGTAIPSSGNVAIAFTYAPTGGGQAKNPYIAVWVETASGTFVDTVSLWYESGANDRYLRDMRAWTSASGGTDKSMSSATRTAGSYSVVWDGNNAAGNKMPQGDYVMFIECARERGPYEVISQPMAIGTTPVTATPSDKGEISKVTMTYTP
jgi:hypothetical protein